MPHLQQLFWDYKDNLKEVSLDLAGNKAYYTYDTSRNRMRKDVVKGNIAEERIYFGGFKFTVNLY